MSILVASPVSPAFIFEAIHKLEGHFTKLTKGACGKPLLSELVDVIQLELIDYGKVKLLGPENAKITNRRRQAFSQVRATNMSRFPSLQVNGLSSLSSVSEDPLSATTPTERTAEREDRKLAMLRRIRPPPLRYAWKFYHDKHSETESYDKRMTLLLDNVVTLKPFWGFLNNFPLSSLKMKDSVHFFKRGINPVWEDSRNINGGAWTFRVTKDDSEKFWQEVLMLAVGEQFAPVLEPRDDICGLSFISRYNASHITIWNRDGSNEKSINAIRDTVLANISPEVKPKDENIFYKKHSDHAGFEEAVAKVKAEAQAKIDKSEAKKAEMEKAEMEAKSEEKAESGDEALVTEEEGNKAMLKDAEGEDVAKLVEESTSQGL